MATNEIHLLPISIIVLKVSSPCIFVGYIGDFTPRFNGPCLPRCFLIAQPMQILFSAFGRLTERAAWRDAQTLLARLCEWLACLLQEASQTLRSALLLSSLRFKVRCQRVIKSNGQYALRLYSWLLPSTSSTSYGALVQMSSIFLFQQCSVFALSAH